MAEPQGRTRRIQVELDERAYQALEKIAGGRPHDEVIGSAIVLAATLKDAQGQGAGIAVETRQLRRISCRLLA